MKPQYWVVKQEPETYAWATFLKEERTAWTGVRNYQARNNLRAMRKGDLVFYYHSGKEKQIVGVARVAAAPYPDPTDVAQDWVAVDLVPVKTLTLPVGLAAIKTDPVLKQMLLARHSRLSVCPVNLAEFKVLLTLAQTKLPQVPG